MGYESFLEDLISYYFFGYGGLGRGGGRFTQSPVALAMSSPTFLGDRPRGPILISHPN